MPHTASLLVALAATLPTQGEPSPTAASIVPRDWLAIRGIDTIYSRRPFRTDAVFARYLLDPSSPPPVEGETVTGENGEGTWQRFEADEKGRLAGGFGYAYCEFEVAESTYALARLDRAGTWFLDGEGRAGDFYGYGFDGVPVELTAGKHRVFVTRHRGDQALRFQPIEQGLHFASWDSVAPHLVVGREPDGFLGVQLLNADRAATGPLVVEYGGDGPIAAGRVDEPSGIAPLSCLRLALPLHGTEVAEGAAEVSVRVVVRDAAGRERLSFERKLGTRGPDDARYLRTYRSDVDGSAQEYAVVPPAGETDHPMQLALALHGAQVHCMGQAQRYEPTPDFWTIAPNNRRPFGFDYQDWGRRDVYDALADALALSGVDRSRVFVTGHSMGGHGSWHLVANDADGFAGCAPAAAWESFDTYPRPRPVGELSDLWFAADASSRTLDLIDNLRQTPAYVQQGTADTNVPPHHALRISEALTKAHGTFEVHFGANAGHGYGNGRGAWRRAFDFLRGRTIPEDPEAIDFTTVDPAVDASHHWVRVEEPLVYGEKLRIRGGLKSGPARLELETTNARVMALGEGAPEAPTLVLDGTELALDGVARPVWLERIDATWRRFEPAADGRRKSSRRSGPFKRAFDRRFVMVVGTAGTDEQDAELLARARYDADVWCYRGNGRAELVTDTVFAGGDYADRNVILYGNRDTNAAWIRVLSSECPIDAVDGRLVVGDETFVGSGIAATFVYPRKGSTEALVGAFAATGTAGDRLGYTLAPFVSGIGYPDYTVFGTSVLQEGDGGVLRAGWFDGGWELPAGRQ